MFLSAYDSEVNLKGIDFSLKKKPSGWTYDEVAKCFNDTFSLGSCCIVIYTKNRIMAFRDPWGYRPLMLAKTAQGYFVASEDVAFWGLDVEEIVEIQPGCGVEITSGGVEYKTFDTTKKHKKSGLIKKSIPPQRSFTSSIKMTSLSAFAKRRNAALEKREKAFKSRKTPEWKLRKSTSKKNIMYHLPPYL